MRISIVALLLSLSFGASAQSLNEARGYFDNYEYGKAASAYDSYSKMKSLSLDDYKKWAYSCFVIGDNAKGFPLADSIIQIREVEPLFFYIHGEMAMGLGKYEEAEASFTKYQKLDNEYDVSVKIQSCQKIPSWKEQEYNTLSNPLGLNDSKANMVGQYYNDVLFVFREVGKDSTGNNDSENVDEAPLVLARPYYISNEGQLQAIGLNSEDPNISISSMVFVPGSNQVVLSASKPLANESIDRAPHLYLANFNWDEMSIDSLELAPFSGYEDTTSCTHPTINQSGTHLVFAKEGEYTAASDLYYSERKGNGWSAAKPFRKINTAFDEMFPKFSGDSILFFSSDGYPGYGALDIFSVAFNNGEIGERNHLNAPVNGLMDDFNFVWLSQDSAVFSSNRIGGHGDDDLYFIGYRKIEILPVVPDSSDFDDFVANWKNVNIYFNFDKYDLEKDFAKMDDLVTFLSHYPNSKITIEGHTDSRGSNEYNMKLGYNRAETVKNELVKRGIHPSQIEITSKGETQPPHECQKCSEADYALNRVAIISLDAK